MELCNEVLIVGAGPTGLVLALWLNRLGVSFRIIDKNTGPGQYSRAIVVHARILEFYRQMGISEAVIAAGLHETEVTARKNGKKVATLPLASLGEGLSPFPFLLVLPQDIHERLLLSFLEKAGVQIEWQTELLEFTQNDAEVEATLKKNNLKEITKFQYVCGCDGAHSTVRHLLGEAFPGGKYSSLFYVADVVAREKDITGVQICTNKEDFCIVVPITQNESMRLIGLVPSEHENKENITFEDVLPSVMRNTSLSVEKINWFSTYQVHHRVSAHFRENRLFLLGDAAHIHSPAGGQGMNTGIGDAVNLSWKIAAVLQHHAKDALLDTYEIERRAFAITLVKSTDQAFRVMANTGWVGKFWRMFLMPHLLPFLFSYKFFARFIFKMLSQIRIHYPNSPLSVGSKNNIKAGDRLPWVKYDNTDNFEPLRSIAWQIHVYGELSENDQKSLKTLDFPVHIFPANPAISKGLAEKTAYFVRPDGYIAVIASLDKLSVIKEFITAWGI